MSVDQLAQPAQVPRQGQKCLAKGAKVVRERRGLQWAAMARLWRRWV